MYLKTTKRRSGKNERRPAIRVLKEVHRIAPGIARYVS